MTNLQRLEISLAITSFCTSLVFGLWQGSFNAGATMFLLLGFVLSCIDYFKETK